MRPCGGKPHVPRRHSDDGCSVSPRLSLPVGSALLILAADCAAFAPASPASFRARHALRSVARAPRRAFALMGGLRAQLGDMPDAKVEDSGKELPEITEEMMLMMALEKRKASALPANSKVMVFGALDRLGQLVVRSRCPRLFGLRDARSPSRP